MDSMTEMFYDESNIILRELRHNLFYDKQEKCINQEKIQEIFRAVHTLKADSAMMLYENMADLSKELETLLYFFRGEGKKIDNEKKFNHILVEYVTFFEKETDKLTAEKMPDGDATELRCEIKEYISYLKASTEEKELEEIKSEVNKPKRQVYYISSAVEEPEKKEDVISIKEKKEDEEEKKYLISEKERQMIYQGSQNLARIVDQIEFLMKKGDTPVVALDQFMKLQNLSQNLELIKKSLTNTDFVPVAKKMEIVVDEMSDKLNKPVKLLVKGEKTLVDIEKREKISSALIHVIRNAVDHGIEDSDTRDAMGKSPMGLIKLKFSMEDSHLKISVKDDGAGIDKEKVLAKAKKMNLLTKMEDEYTEKEIWNLLFENGMTTKNEANDFSGRGVGMDVLKHNVEELGGKIKISSKDGLGTSITMKF